MFSANVFAFENFSLKGYLGNPKCFSMALLGKPAFENFIFFKVCVALLKKREQSNVFLPPAPIYWGFISNPVIWDESASLWFSPLKWGGLMEVWTVFFCFPTAIWWHNWLYMCLVWLCCGWSLWCQRVNKSWHLIWEKWLHSKKRNKRAVMP